MTPPNSLPFLFCGDDSNNVAPPQPHWSSNPDILVNSGALKLAINVLRRAGKNEVADELEMTITSPQPVTMPIKWTGRVTESIFSKDGYMIPLAKVQHITSRRHSIAVVMDSSTYNSEIDEYNNAVFLPLEIAEEFKAVWCRYRSELEAETLIDLSPAQPVTASVDNPWREFIENCISGANYFRASEYRELLVDLDRLYTHTQPVITPAPIGAEIKLYRWLEYVVRWQGQLSPGDVDDANKVLTEFSQFKGVGV